MLSLGLHIDRSYKHQGWQVYGRRQCPMSRNIGAVIAFVHCVQSSQDLEVNIRVYWKRQRGVLSRNLHESSLPIMKLEGNTNREMEKIAVSKRDH
jgi:hypothetical protein